MVVSHAVSSPTTAILGLDPGIQGDKLYYKLVGLSLRSERAWTGQPSIVTALDPRDMPEDDAGATPPPVAVSVAAGPQVAPRAPVSILIAPRHCRYQVYSAA